MSESDPLHAFTVAALEDLGAAVRDDGALLWLTLPEDVQASLDLPAQACVTFDPGRIGEFDAELIAPGSYLLERLIGLATHRGRWDVARFAVPSDDWAAPILRSVPGLGPEDRIEIHERKDEPLALFAFRTALTSDEKREAFHLVAATLEGSEAWTVPWPLPERGMTSSGLPGAAPDLELAYRAACTGLNESMGPEMEAFQKSSLAALEEEVRRIFHYFDGTVAEVRDAAPSGSADVVRAIEAERDRRLAEALERFEPHATATLCSVRLVVVPMVRASVRGPSEQRVEVCVDALTRRVRGPADLTGAGLARPRGRPRSDTLPPRTKDD